MAYELRESNDNMSCVLPEVGKLYRDRDERYGSDWTMVIEVRRLEKNLLGSLYEIDHLLGEELCCFTICKEVSWFEIWKEYDEKV